MMSSRTPSHTTFSSLEPLMARASHFWPVEPYAFPRLPGQRYHTSTPCAVDDVKVLLHAQRISPLSRYSRSGLTWDLLSERFCFIAAMARFHSFSSTMARSGTGLGIGGSVAARPCGLRRSGE